MKRVRSLFLVFLLPLTCLRADEARLQEAEGELRFANEHLALLFDRASGIWTGLETGSGTVLFRRKPEQPSLDLQVGKDRLFPTGGAVPTLRRQHAGRTEDATQLDLVLTKDNWEVTATYILRDDGTLLRRATFAYLGAAPEALTEVRDAVLSVPSLSLPGEDAFWFAAAEYPARDHPFRHTDPGREFRFPFSDVTFHSFLVCSPTAGLNLASAYYSEEERAIHLVREAPHAATVVHTHRVVEFLRPKLRFTVGTQLLRTVPGTREDTLRALQGFYDVPGLRTKIGMPADTGRNIFYSAHAGGTIDSSFRDVGGFANFTKLLPEIRSLGVNVLWLLPFWYGPVYAPYDYYRLDPKRCGTPEELRALADRAHGLGMRVVGDLIPHGPRPGGGVEPTFAEQHADWICRDQQGNMITWWGCHYCDYAHPGWQDYMAKHAAYWVRECGLDGYRVDVAAGGAPNWRPYGDNRPSFSGLKGGLELMRQARAACLKENPKTLFLAESHGPTMYSAAEHGYHWAFVGLLRDHALKDDPATFVQAMSGYLENQTYAFPADAFPIRYLTNHDRLRARYLYGPDLHRALLALCAFMKGAPLLYHEEEIGNEDFLANLYRIRQTYDELSVGTISYTSIPTQPKHVFSILREHNGNRSIALINYSNQPTVARLSLPESPTQELGICEAATGKRMPYSGSTNVHLEPFGYAVLVIRDGNRLPPPKLLPAPPLPNGPHPLDPINISREGDIVTIATPRYCAVVDGNRGGLLREIRTPRGQLLLHGTELSEGVRKLFVGCDPLEVGQTKATLTVDKGGATAAGQLQDMTGTPRLGFRILYVALPDELTCSVSLTPLTELPPTKSDFALRLRLAPTSHWFADTREGSLLGRTIRRHPDPHGFGGRYWHGSGEAFFDSSLHPLASGFGVLDARRRLAIEVEPQVQDGACPRARLLEDKSPDSPAELGKPGAAMAEIRILDGDQRAVWERGKERLTKVELRFPAISADSRGVLRPSRRSPPVPGSWQTFGPKYILDGNGTHAEATRCLGGALTRLTDANGRGVRIGDVRFYTDNGLFGDWTDPRGKVCKMNAHSHDDPEPDTQIVPYGDAAERVSALRFHSYFRHPYGGGRSMLTPRLEYEVTYVPPSQPGQGLRVECGVRPHLAKQDAAAFLAYKLSLKDCDQWQLDGGEWQPFPEKSARIWESSVAGSLPKSLAIRNSKTGDWTRFSDFVGGDQQVQNIFLHANGTDVHLFVAFYDIQPTNIGPLWRRAAFTIQAGGDQ